MKTYKRIIALLLAAAAILSLAGCGKNKTDEPAPSAGADTAPPVERTPVETGAPNEETSEPCPEVSETPGQEAAQV